MLLDQLASYRIILASRSPRRRELLTGMGITFETQVQDAEEIYPSQLPSEQIPAYLAQLKLTAFNPDELTDHTIVIGCDTLVFLEGSVLGKSRDEAEMKSMLKCLSGHTHKVISGICLKTKNETLVESVSSNVKFKNLSDEEIDYYVHQYHPMDKAGSYGVQEWIGYIGIESIEGSFYNVMGLPTVVLWKMLQHIVSKHS